MSFSIITVALNAADALPATLESVLQQDFGAVETIVVDGTSWDATSTVLADYRGEIDKFATTFDAGIFYAMNEAARLATNEYVLFMNAGDRFYAADTLSTIWDRRIGDPDIMYGDHLYADGPRTTLARAADYGLSRAALLKGEVSQAWLAAIPAHQATFTRTALLQEYGYDTAFEICADHAFLLKAYDRGARMQYIDEIVSLYAAGGMSIRRHERCRLEFCALYRAHSLRPDRVDHHFYGKGPPPFPMTSPLMGAAVSGIFADDPLIDGAGEPLSWCAGEGFRLMSPAGGRAHTLVLEGHTEIEDQALTLAADGVDIGKAAVPPGHFRVAIALASPLVPGSVVDCWPRTGVVVEPAAPEAGPDGGAAPGGVSAGVSGSVPGAVPGAARDGAAGGARAAKAGRYISMALKRFHFELLAETDLPALPFGETHFKASHPGSAALLAHGWAAPEGTHVWSIVARPELAFRAAGPAERIILSVRSNPFLAEAQTLTVTLNGHALARTTLDPPGTGRKVEVDVGPAWSAEGANWLALAVSATAQPPGDPRNLGLALEKIEVVAAAPVGAAPDLATSDPATSDPAAPEAAR